MTTAQNPPNGYIILTGHTEPETGGYNAYCPELGIATCADTADQALDNLGDAIAVYLDDWDAPADLHRMLQDSGLKIQTAPVSPDLVNIAIPSGQTVRTYIQPLPAPVSAAA